MVVPGPSAHAQLVTAYAAGPALGEEVWGQGQRLPENLSGTELMQVYKIPPSKN